MNFFNSIKTSIAQKVDQVKTFIQQEKLKLQQEQNELIKMNKEGNNPRFL